MSIAFSVPSQNRQGISVLLQGLLTSDQGISRGRDGPKGTAMAQVLIGRHSCVTGIGDSANNNDIPVRRTNNDARQNLPEESDEASHVTDEDIVIVRDPVSGDWLVEDYAGEAVLFHLPRDCSLDEVRRAAALYAAAFRSGFEQGRFVARATRILR
jgi:hypothetical protein